MNTSSSQVLNEVVRKLFVIEFSRYMTMAAYAVAIYEWVECSREEYIYVHKARQTSVKFAYLLCRYIPLLLWPVYLWALLGDHHVSVCAKWAQPLYIVLILPIALAQVVFIIRTYAFTGHNKLVLTVLVVLWSALLGASLWKQYDRWAVDPDWQQLIGDFPCFGKDRRVTSVTRDQIHAVFKLATFLLDSVMMAIVFIHCFHYRSMWGPLGKVFVAQGLIAYVMLSALHLATAITLFKPNSRVQGVCFLGPNLSCVIACRLILMLKRRADPTATTQVRNQSLQIRKQIRDELVYPESPITDDTASGPPIEHWH